jgi:hypothetical protein
VVIFLAAMMRTPNMQRKQHINDPSREAAVIIALNLADDEPATTARRTRHSGPNTLAENVFRSTEAGFY